jgi:hypothetical protein
MTNVNLQELLWNVFTRLMEKGQFKELFVRVKWNTGTGKLSDLLLVQLSDYQRRSGNEQLAVNLCNFFLNIKD